MTIRISGTLKNASGVRPNTQIILQAAKTTSSVVIFAPDRTIVTDASGMYSFDCNNSIYNVFMQQPGFQRESVGVIAVYPDSPPGSIEDFLTNLTPDDLTPEIVKEVLQYRNEAREAAAEAKTSETNAAASELSAHNDAVQVAADKQQVSTDAAQVAQDKTVVTQSASQVAQDKVQVAADAQQVALDRIQTGQDAATATTKATEAADSARRAEEAANLTVIYGGPWTPTGAGEYPDVTSNVKDTKYEIDLARDGTYTFTGGQLAGEVVTNGDSVTWDLTAPSNRWVLIKAGTLGALSKSIADTLYLGVTKEAELKQYADTKAQEQAHAGDSQASGGGIYPVDSTVSASTLPPNNDIPAGTIAIRDASGINLYKFTPSVSGTITALDFSAGTATIGGTPVLLYVPRTDTLLNFASALEYVGQAKKITTSYHTQIGIGADEYVLTGSIGTPSENLYGGGKFNDPLGREWASTSFYVKPSTFGVLPSTTSGNDYTTQMQKCVNFMSKGSVFVSDVETAICKSMSIEVVRKVNCTFEGNSEISVSDHSVASNSRGVFVFVDCDGCDFKLYGNGNNQNNTNNTNGEEGLLTWCKFLNCKDSNMKDGRCRNANNESYYIAEGCVNCEIYDNTSIDAFGTDFKLGGSTVKRSHIRSNKAVVTRNIHSEKGTGVTGKQDGFVAIRFGVEDCSAHDNTGDNTDKNGNNYGVLAYGLWATGMKGTFKSYNNTWTGGDNGDYFNLDDGLDLELLLIKDTVKNSGSCVTILTTGSSVANIKSLDIDCEFSGGGLAGAVAIDLISNQSRLTIEGGSVNLISIGTIGAYAINNEVGNIDITGVIDHSDGTSHAVQLNGGNDNKVDVKVKMGGQDARSINLLDSSNNIISGCRTKGDYSISIMEQGSSDGNVFTSNITSKTIHSIGIGSYVDPNSNLIIP